MFEKVNMSHPDKIADRIAGAIVDLAYTKNKNPKVAVEVLIGHGNCHIINETSETFTQEEIEKIVHRISRDSSIKVDYKEYKQDAILAENQNGKMRCGDNGIFRGVPTSYEEKSLSLMVQMIYRNFPYDGKYMFANGQFIICQSNATKEDILKLLEDIKVLKIFNKEEIIINPLGDWTGGLNVDTGATNRKLGSDMGRAVTGGGLCLSGDTEYLGEDLKWHRMDSYNSGKVAQWNDGVLEFVVPSKYIHNESDNFIKIWNDTKLSMELTPYHNVLIETSKGNLIKKPAYLIAKKLDNQQGDSGKIIHNFTYKNETHSTSYPTESDYRLQVAFCADGTILNNQNKWSGRIRVKKQRKIDRMRMLLKGHNYLETKDGEYSIFWFNPIKVSKSLYDCFRNEDYSILYDEIFHWDGTIERKQFYTTNKIDADFVQFVIGTMGKVATIMIDDRVNQEREAHVYKSVCYTVHELKSTKTFLRVSKGVPIKVEYKNEKNPSYCFEVPSHNLIVRHNNKIFVTGNCGKDLSKADVSVNIYAYIKAQKKRENIELSCSIGDEKIDGKPYKEIVKIAREYVEEIGGFEKLAEWGLIY